ncbi:helix-turn-helix domain-containing protein [Pontiella agarivorans]|uniref:AraC family transcriptional regulator n=1 Tax=Pontiella agarivorans TaxID=3038953 RepID=A0ABU5N0R4_9BACT|nr:helix-turn-helix domain-containing protein [Pontiella agarivorans]MDZ8120013.1 AraC family transcriptional regulator [Pontiella agarivorans]
MKLTLEYFLREIVPLISAQFFLAFLIYFTLIKKQIKRIYPFYAAFIISFILFLGGRLLHQWLSTTGIANALYIRMFLLFGVGIPSLLLATAIQMKYRVTTKWYFIAYVPGVVFSLLYILIRDCVSICEIGKFFGYTPRQIKSLHLTIWYVHGLQIAAAFLMMVVPSVLFISKKDGNINVRYNLIGVLLFGISMIIGTALQEWWILYSSSIICVIFWGVSIYLDIRQMRDKAEVFSPLIHEELFHSIGKRSATEATLSKLFNAVGVTSEVSRFIVIKPDLSVDDVNAAAFSGEFIHQELGSDIFHGILEAGNYVFLPSGSLNIGLCICEGNTLDENSILAVGEALRESVEKHLSITVSVGIGTSYSSLSELRLSYQEAYEAVLHASSNGGNMVVRYTDLAQSAVNATYPFRLRQELLLKIRSGHVEDINDNIHVLLEKLNTFCHGRSGVLKQRVHEIIFMISDAVISDGGDPVILFDRMEISGVKIDQAASVKEVEEIVHRETIFYAKQIAEVGESRVDNVVERALAFIAEHYGEDIGVGEIAEKLNVSRSYLMALFKKSTGHTVNQHLTDVRIEMAKVILMKKNVTETAFEVGFNSSNYFTTVFKKQLGMTPKDYQFQNRQD